MFIKVGILLWLVAAFIIIRKKFPTKKNVKITEKLKQELKFVLSIPILGELVKHAYRKIAYTCSESYYNIMYQGETFVLKYITNTLIFALILAIVAPNIFFVTLFIAFRIIIFDYELLFYVSNEYKELMRSALRTISSLSDKYKVEHDINMSLSECFHNNNCGYIIEMIRDTISGEVDIEEAKISFTERMKIPIFRILAVVCQIEDEIGEAFTSVTNGFLRDLEILRYDINSENLKILKYDNKFSANVLVPIIGVATSIPIYYFLCIIFPSVEHMFNGWYGFITYLVLAIGFIISVIIGRDTMIYFTDFSDNILQLIKTNEKQKKVLIKVFCGSDEKLKKLQDRLNKARFIGGVDKFFTDKIAYALIAFVVMLLSVIAYNHSAIVKERNSIATYAMSVTQYTDIEVKQIKEIDDQLLSEEFSERIGDMVAEADEKFCESGQLWDRYRTKLTNALDEQITEQTTRFVAKYKSLKNQKITWWIFCIVIIITILAYYTPDFVLMYMESRIKQKETEEVFSIATINVVLSNTQFPISRALDIIQDLCVILKNYYIVAIEEFSDDPITALQKLADEVDNQDFKVYQDKMQNAIFNLTIDEAYNDAYEEKKRMQNERNEIIEANIDYTNNMLLFVRMIPMAISLAMMFILPFAIVTIQSLLDNMAKAGRIAGT